MSVEEAVQWLQSSSSSLVADGGGWPISQRSLLLHDLAPPPPGVQSSKWIFVGRERKRLECKMGLGERLLYLCLNERHTQGDRDKAHGSESSPKPT